jgi:transposase
MTASKGRGVVPPHSPANRHTDSLGGWSQFRQKPGTVERDWADAGEAAHIAEVALRGSWRRGCEQPGGALAAGTVSARLGRPVRCGGRRLDRRTHQRGRDHAAGADRVAIERGDGPVVEELLVAGFAVFVVPSRQIKGLRTRYGSAGNKDDRFDAYVLADTLRADGHRWKPLRPDTEPTKALRALCRSRKDLVETRVQVLGQLRANLELAFPGAIGLFTKPASGISLAFLRRFPTSGKAAWLSPARMANWLRSVGYTGGISAVVLHGRLTAAAPGLTGPEGEARGQITLALVAMLDVLNDQVRVLDIEIAAAFAAHPD